MQVLSATEAIAPAFKRAWEQIYRPFRVGGSWKMAAIGLVSGFAMIYLPSIPAMGSHALSPDVPNSARVIIGIVQAFMGFFCVVLSILIFGIFYLGARMQFVLLETIATRQTAVAPLWRKYGDRTWRWVGIKLIPSAFLVLPFVFFMQSFSQKVAAIQAAQMQPGQPPNFHFVFAVWGVIAGIWFLGSLAIFASSLIGDFLLPPVALENSSLALACNRFGRAFTEDPGAFLLYVFLKMILFPIAAICGYMIAGFVIGIPTVVVVVLGVIAFHLAHGLAAHIALGLCCALAVLLMLAYMVYVYVMIVGTIVTFFQSFGMYFYGGRYQPLGDLMEPPIAPVAPLEVAPPVDDLPPMFLPPETVG